MERSAGLNPTQRLLDCAAKIAGHYRLPYAGRVQIAVDNPTDTLALRRLSESMLSQAQRELEIFHRIHRDFDLPKSLARHCGWATALAHQLYSAASEGSTAAPSDEAWELLMMMTTVLYGQARRGNKMYELTTFYSDLAVALREDEPEL